MTKVAKGFVFKSQHRSLSSPLPHYLIALTTDDNSENIVVFGVVTSGIDKAHARIEKMGAALETLVTITPAEYCELDHESVVDCNTPVYYSKWNFEKEFNQLNATRKTDLSNEICDKIIHGMNISKVVPPRIKKAIASS